MKTETISYESLVCLNFKMSPIRFARELKLDDKLVIKLKKDDTDSEENETISV